MVWFNMTDFDWAETEPLLLSQVRYMFVMTANFERHSCLLSSQRFVQSICISKSTR